MKKRRHATGLLQPSAVILHPLCYIRRAMLNLHDYRLGNGLRVVLNEDHSAPLVAINIWYHVGSKNEPRGRTGFAHLFEHMLFSGSEHVGNNEHFRYVQSVGGVLNGTTFFDRTNYYETMPSNYLALALWLESDRMGFFVPALTHVGDFNPDEAKQLIEQYFGDIKPGGSFPPFTLERRPLGGERRETFASPVQLPRVYRLYHLPKMGTPEWIHADLLTTLLAGDKASRLEKALVMEKQIATDVAAYVLPTEATGMLMLQATAQEGRNS